MSDPGEPVPGSESALSLVDDDALNVPNCLDCLHPMDAASTSQGGVFWQCTNCGQTKIA